MIETRCGNCRFGSTLADENSHLIASCEVDSDRPYKLAKNGGKLDWDEMGNAIIQNKLCKYYTPYNIPSLDKIDNSDLINAIKKLNTNKIHVFFIDNNSFNNIIDSVNKLNNDVEVTIITSNPSSIPNTYFTENRSAIHFSEEDIVNGKYYETIDNKIPKKKIDYHIYIYQDRDYQFSQKDIDTLNYHVNDLCKQIAVVYGDGFVIYNTVIYRMLGGETRIPQEFSDEEFNQCDFYSKILRWCEKYSVGHQMILDWEELDES